MSASIGTVRADTPTNDSSGVIPRSRVRACWEATVGRIVRPPHHRTVDALRTALIERDTDGVESLLRDDVALVVDPGPSSDSSMRILTGRRVATAALLHGTDGGRSVSLEVRSVNGQAGLVLRSGHETTSVVCVDLTGGLISALWIRLRPDQLRHGNHI